MPNWALCWRAGSPISLFIAVYPRWRRLSSSFASGTYWSYSPSQGLWLLWASLYSSVKWRQLQQSHRSNVRPKNNGVRTVIQSYFSLGPHAHAFWWLLASLWMYIFRNHPAKSIAFGRYYIVCWLRRAWATQPDGLEFKFWLSYLLLHSCLRLGFVLYKMWLTRKWHDNQKR